MIFCKVNVDFPSPLNSKNSVEFLNEFKWFKDKILPTTEIKFWITSATIISELTFDKKDKHYSNLVNGQQEIIDICLSKCIEHVKLHLDSNTYISVKGSKVELFILGTIINNKTRKFNLQLIHLLSNEQFCHRNLTEKKQAINTFKT